MSQSVLVQQSEITKLFTNEVKTEVALNWLQQFSVLSRSY